MLQRSIDATTLLGLFGALQGVVLAVAVASLGGDAKRPSRALAFLLASFAVAVGSVTAQHAGMITSPLPGILTEFLYPHQQISGRRGLTAPH